MLHFYIEGYVLFVKFVQTQNTKFQINNLKRNEKPPKNPTFYMKELTFQIKLHYGNVIQGMKKFLKLCIITSC